MAGITLEQAETQLAAYLAAETALLTGAQEYTIDIGGSRRTVKKSDLQMIQTGIKTWEGRVHRLTRSGRLPVSEVIPR